MFNQPEVIALLQSCYESHTIQPYWQKVLLYCLDGNLQAVMDEYVHVLYESMGLVGHDVGDCAAKLADRLSMVVSLRAAMLQFDEITASADGRVGMDPRRIRCRYALRYGSDASMEWQEGVRDEEVWTAFNSPFRPFVLATTSIGQEGLDFHQYCHRVVHWNLPSNPVDLEQREGRVHRYKGHVIRRNLGEHYGLSALRADGGDPWAHLFALAVRDRHAGANDLVPFWIYEPTNGQGIVHKIERQVPLFPLSREVGKLEALKNALAAYRCVIGQPRQQEMLAFLTNRLGPEGVATVSEIVALDLSPRPRDALG